MTGIPYRMMEGLGNTFIVVDARVGSELGDRGALARAVCAKGSGFGVDGLLVIDPPAGATHDVRAEIWNADGTPGGMCGNGVRCIALLLREEAAGGELSIGIAGRTVVCRTGASGRGGASRIDVNMGAPVFDHPEIPVDPARADGVDAPRLRIAGEWGIAVSFGNPHFVVFVDTLPTADALAHRGSTIEHHPAFPRRTNAHFVRIARADRLELTPWERGVGATRACASGACATFAAARLFEVCAPAADVAMPGGDLRLREDTGGSIWCAGPATLISGGTWARDRSVR